MKQYLDLLRTVLQEGSDVPQRAKVDGQHVFARTCAGLHLRHDLAQGFPLLTSKRVPLGLVASELWFFLHGCHRKEDLHAFGNQIWDEWEKPTRPGDPPDHGELGRIYGVQWRDWTSYKAVVNHAKHQVMERRPIDQLRNLLEGLAWNPWDRRLVVTAWNPGELGEMALPPCHMIWQAVATFSNEPRSETGSGLKPKLNLCMTMRSADMMLGVPFNIASYALLLLLLAKHAKMVPGVLSVTFNNAHIYEHHLEAAREQVKRLPGILPEVKIPDRAGGEPFDILEWTPDEVNLLGYKAQAAIPLKVAV